MVGYPDDMLDSGHSDCTKSSPTWLERQRGTNDKKETDWTLSHADLVDRPLETPWRPN
ncbi:hypothetical protein DPMN_144953 [Dreissena polymorpha]|uniref:Uncharacterized protein n=1 Tax=Dreissena polymorpha TaxID=45954 RepID=A0A9D4J0U7_DREPO|nr:hypothetical protein DPMN_144953 [Dreissena polymorpha]